MEEMQIDNVARTHKLEVAVEGIASSLRAFMDSTDRAHQDFRTEIKDLARAHNNSQKPQYTLIVSVASLAVAVIIALVSLGAAGPLGILSDLKAQNTKLEDAIHSHRTLEAHPGGVARLKALELRQDANLSAVDRRLTIVEDWQRRNNVASTEKHARNTARIDSLERAVTWRARVTAANR